MASNNKSPSLSYNEELTSLEENLIREMSREGLREGIDIKNDIMKSIIENLYDQVAFLKDEIVFLRQESHTKTRTIDRLMGNTLPEKK